MVSGSEYRGDATSPRGQQSPVQQPSPVAASSGVDSTPITGNIPKFCPECGAKTNGPQKVY